MKRREIKRWDTVHKQNIKDNVRNRTNAEILHSLDQKSLVGFVVLDTDYLL